MAGGKTSGTGLASVAAGALFVYAGLTGKSVSKSLQAIIQGQSPARAGQAYPILGSAQSAALSSALASGTQLGPNVTGGSVSGDAIASDALRYKGASYVWGGAPARGVGNWDCSSFANWVCGHDEHLPIPGYPAGAYSGDTHGPPTGVWLLWGGLRTIGHDGGQAQAGDLCIWQTHMGIALGPDSMISAQNPSSGTQVSGINGFIGGELLYVRRYP